MEYRPAMPLFYLSSLFYITYINKYHASFSSEWFLDSLFTWQTQLKKESGATIVIHKLVCMLSKAIKSTRVAHVPSSEALLHAKSSYSYANTGHAMSPLLMLWGPD